MADFGPRQQGIDTYEYRAFPEGSAFYRGGFTPASPEFQYYTTLNQADEYRIHHEKDGNSRLWLTCAREPLKLFCMTQINCARLDTPTASSGLRRKLVEVLGYEKASSSPYIRVATSLRSPKRTVYKTPTPGRLQVHTHDFLTRANQRRGNYAALSLARELQGTLCPLGFDGWIYEHDAAMRPGASDTNTAIVPFHPEVLVWNTSKLSPCRG